MGVTVSSRVSELVFFSFTITYGISIIFASQIEMHMISLLNMNFQLIKLLVGSFQVAFLDNILFFLLMVSKEQPLCIKHPQFSHEVKVEKRQTHQQVLHQIEDGCDKAKEGY